MRELIGIQYYRHSYQRPCYFLGWKSGDVKVNKIPLGNIISVGGTDMLKFSQN